MSTKTWLRKKMGSPELRKLTINHRVIRFKKLLKEESEARGILKSKGHFVR